ncbi:hypothetical protein V8J82_01155 [Gymnodinialimonas sp. 2305UL16-5]|uniref:hypothetical protein n=1 Tax=Gymnodinialimonas mytili TaxID=3126503 RepID=UPI0030A506D8
MQVRTFVADEAGVATVDWVVVASVMVALGVAVKDQVDDGLSVHSSEIRDEFQGGLFDSAWDANLAVPIEAP